MKQKIRIYNLNFQKPNDVYISKTLSWLLRHGAVKEKLNIDSEGFVNVEEILNTKNFNRKYVLDDIVRVVETNDKKRFDLRTFNGVLKIRAVQGHTLKVVVCLMTYERCFNFNFFRQVVNSLELEEITDESEINDVIHGTYYKFWESIKKNGLSRMTRNHIHFACGLPSDNCVISGIRKTCQIYIYVDFKSALKTGIKFYKSMNNVILSSGDESGCIDTKYFLKVVDAKTGSEF